MKLRSLTLLIVCARWLLEHRRFVLGALANGCAFGMALAMPAMSAITQAYFPDMRGMAASVQNFVQMFIFALISGCAARRRATVDAGETSSIRTPADKNHGMNLAMIRL